MPTVQICSETAGAVWKIEAEPGARIAAGDAVIILESMKMEFPVCSPHDGVLLAVAVAEGEMVVEGQLLATLDVA